MIRVRILWVLAAALIIAGGGLAYRTLRTSEPDRARPEAVLVLATTTSVQDSGLLEALLPAFEKESGIRVRVVPVGTGKALELGRLGEADAVLCHAPTLEEAFVRDGYSQDRRLVARNDFVIVGPPEDRAGVGSAKTAVEALTRIALARQSFVSRGDGSGTHLKEQALLDEAGIALEDSWYRPANAGMGATLRLASERNSYALADRATFVTYREKVRLTLLHSGGAGLDNPYSVLVVSPRKNPETRAKEATRFADYLTGPVGQRLIAEFGTARYGEALFKPAQPSD